MANEQQPLTLFEISPSVQNVCQCSLDIVSGASSHQIQAAIDYNKPEINKLLVQLLTINFIQKNEQIIQNETKQFLETNDNNNNNNTKLENYCSQKLLEISPIHGFSPKPYFLDYKISNDIRMEILTYLKPIQLFETISLLNKQFNKNVQAIHESTNGKYSKIFDTKNFTFDSFLEMEDYCSNNKRKALHNGFVYIDYRSVFGFWYFDSVTSIDTYTQRILASTCSVPLDCLQVAPYKSMTFRHCNKNKFTNKILKRGYLNETCDINISKFAFVSTKNCNLKFDLSRGHVDSSEILNDLWICGKINFRMTLENLLFRIGDQIGITVTSDIIHDKIQYDKIFDKMKKSFNIFQIYVDIDITKYFNKYSLNDTAALYAMGAAGTIKQLNGRHILTVTAHGDDASTLTYFGDKSSIDERREIITNGFCDMYLNESKRKFLDLIDYPNYCLLRPTCQPLCRLGNEHEFNRWINFYDKIGFITCLISGGTMKLPIDQKMLKHVYYDERKDELHVKNLVNRWTLIFKDSDAPKPLKNAYCHTLASKQRPRVVDVIITEPDIIDIDDELYSDHNECNINCNDYDVGMELGTKIKNEKKIDKKEIYFERLSKWKGFLKCTFDITDVFNEFENRLRDEWIKNNNGKNTNINKISIENGALLGNNRRYFTNFNGKDMPYIKWERRTNRIKHDYYLWLNNIVDYDYQLTLSDVLGEYKSKILSKIFFYTRASDQDARILAGVCREWRNFMRYGGNIIIINSSAILNLNLN